MDYTQEAQKGKFVIGLAVQTSNDHGRFQKEVPPLWQQFVIERRADTILNRKGSDLLAVYVDYEGDYAKPFTYIVGCEVTNLDVIPEGLVGVEIQPATYAVFTAKGDFPKSLQQTWEKIWRSDIKRAYQADFEVYGRDFDPQNRPEIKIYISLESS